MSTAAMHPTPQRTQAPLSSSPYTSSTPNRSNPPSSAQNHDAFYANQAYPAPSSQASRRQGRPNGHSASTSSPISPEQYYSPPSSDPSDLNMPHTQTLPPSGDDSPQMSSAAAGGHNRNRSVITDRYDGPPIPPPRTSSQQQPPPPSAMASSAVPAGSRIPTTRHTRQNTAEDRNYGGQDQNYGGDYSEPVRERPRENTTTAAAAAARSRRQGPTTPEAPHQNASSRDHEQQSDAVSQSQSNTAAVNNSVPPPLMRENSEVINRVIVSDPQVDAERMQERLAEAVPSPIGSDVTPVTGLGLVGSEGVDDGGRGGARRQDYARSTSRRKDVQFGDYMLGQTLGEGEFGKVKLGWKRDGSMQVAIKLIRRETVATNPSRLPKIYREISILRDLAHPNIVRLHEMVETERHIGIILEYASGGELFDYILNHRYLKDQAARRLFAQLVSGVGYLHKKGIVHRDLKLENLLLDQNRNIIITDFGFANTFNPADELSDEIEYNLGNREFVRKYRLDRQDEKGMRKGDLMQTSCGSPCYAAPELVVSDSLYTGRKVDVWSCGVILYAMLAGYLPFDDDPANPEGDNINLLYKYITSTPLTFPEYVTPHARDLLRRILVPDPRKRADLFEVARHSWLSEYHHVVSHITSSTTNIADIQNSTIPHEDQLEAPILNRSASVREPSKTPSATSAIGALNHQHQANLTKIDDVESSRSQRDRNARHTLQPEYVAPQSHTIRGDGSAAAVSETPKAATPGSRAQTAPVAQSASRSKPLPQEPVADGGKVADYPVTSATQQKMPARTRHARDTSQSVSGSTGAFDMPPIVPSSSHAQVTRPSTGGSMTSMSGPSGTRSDIRLPSRGSYGQPVAPTVAATNVQGRVTQPTNGRGYSISGPMPQHGPQSIGQPMAQALPAKYNETPAAPPAQPAKNHHRRSSTLSGLGERLFGRSGSVMKKQDRESPRQSNGRKYPPTSMKDPYAAENPRRPSIDSKRSFSFGLGKKKSVDLESQQGEKSGRRFSLIPASMSFKGTVGSGKEHGDPESPVPEPDDFPQPPTSRGQSRPPTSQQPQMNSYDAPPGVQQGNDGQYDQQRPVKVNNFSRPPQQYQQHQKTSSHTPNDIYGGTGVYEPTSQYLQHQERSYLSGPTPPVESEARRANPGQPPYPEGFNDYDRPRPPMQQARQGKGPGVLQKPNRKFVDAYNNEQGPTHHEGSSGPAKKVMDFFRRRGRARVDEYR